MMMKKKRKKRSREMKAKMGGHGMWVLTLNVRKKNLINEREGF